jgi:hypothetical protein
VPNLLYHQQTVHNLFAPSTGIKLRAIDEEVRSPLLFESGWSSKRQSVRFTVAFVLYEDFVNRRLGLNVFAFGRVTSLCKGQIMCKREVEPSYLDYGGGIYDW